MKALSFFLFVSLMYACSYSGDNNLIMVKGAKCINPKSNLYGQNIKVADFFMGRYEVTQKEWIEIMGYNPSFFKGDSLPVEMVTWYNCIEYCIKRSLKEGLQPYYTIDSLVHDAHNICEHDSTKWLVTVNPGANGYRLPSEVEWEYAAGGGQKSNGYVFSGSNEITDVAWYWQNSGKKALSGVWSWPNIKENENKTHPVGTKQANELGLYDMSGNVREWCEDWYVDQQTQSGIFRSQRGGGWMGIETRCRIANRDNFEANGKGSDQGFRVCRSK